MRKVVHLTTPIGLDGSNIVQPMTLNFTPGLGFVAGWRWRARQCWYAQGDGNCVAANAAIEINWADGSIPQQVGLSPAFPSPIEHEIATATWAGTIVVTPIGTWQFEGAPTTTDPRFTIEIEGEPIPSGARAAGSGARC